MIINKNTSDAKLVQYLVVTTDTGKPITNVLEFDTTTLIAELNGGGSSAGANYWFDVGVEADADYLRGLLGAEDPERVLFGTKKNTKKAMAASTLPDDVLQVKADITLMGCICSNCATMFVAGVGGNKVYKLYKPNAADVLFTLTELDAGDMVCDNCGQPVSLIY